MKLSNETITVLKNYAGINPNIVFKPGNVLSTISEVKTVLAEANISEDIPSEFGIYDLNQFLSVLAMFKDPELEIKDNFILIKSGKSCFKYFFSDPRNLTAPTSSIAMPEADVVFDLSAEDLNAIKKASGTMGAKDLVIEPGLTLTITDLKDATANSFQMDVPGDAKKDKFKIILNIDNLKILPGDYKVSIAGKTLAQFVGETATYYIAVEHNSKY